MNKTHSSKQGAAPDPLDTQAQPWNERMDTLQLRMDGVEQELGKAGRLSGMHATAASEAIEIAIDEIAGALFAFHVPRYPVDGPAKRLKELRRRVSDLYARLQDLRD